MTSVATLRSAMNDSGVTDKPGMFARIGKIPGFPFDVSRTLTSTLFVSPGAIMRLVGVKVTFSGSPLKGLKFPPQATKINQLINRSTLIRSRFFLVGLGRLDCVDISRFLLFIV